MMRMISYEELTDPALGYFIFALFFLVALFILINLFRGTYHLMVSDRKERDDEAKIWSNKGGSTHSTNVFHWVRNWSVFNIFKRRR